MNFSINKFLEIFNLENINKGMSVFDKVIQDFGNSMDQLTNELNTTSKNKPNIWSDKKDDSQKIIDDMEKIWGKKK
jgi:hypothetical protein